MGKDIVVNDIYMHMLQKKYRVIICYGGRDSGKSFFIGGQYIPFRMLNNKYFRGVCIRDTYASLKDSCYQEILDGVYSMDLQQHFRFLKSPLEINTDKDLTNKDSRMIFRGMDSPSNIKSLKGINFIWYEEAENITEKEFWDLLILLRGGGVKEQQLILSFNPVDSDHFTNAMFAQGEAVKVLQTFDDGERKVWVQKVEEEIEGEKVSFEALVMRSTFDDNKFISAIRKAAIEQLKYSDPYLYEVYRKGCFGTKGGRILTNFEIIDFEKEGFRFDMFDNKGYGADWGFNHASAILSVAEHDNCLYVFDEIYEFEKDNTELIDLAFRKGISKQITMIGDSAEPDRIKQWQRAGYRIRDAYKYPGSVQAQIDKLKAFRRIYINNKCVNTIKEAKSWSWKQDRKGNYTDEPVPIYDDAMAALRYSTDLFSSNTKVVAAKRIW